MTGHEVLTLLGKTIKSGEWEIRDDKLHVKVMHQSFKNLNYVPMVITLTPNDMHCHLRTFGLANVAESQVGKALTYCNELNKDMDTSFFINDNYSIDTHYSFLLLDDDTHIRLCGGAQILRVASEIDVAFGVLQKYLG